MATIDFSQYKQQKLDLQIEAEAKVLFDAEAQFEKRSPTYKGELAPTKSVSPMHRELGINGVHAILMAGTPV